MADRSSKVWDSEEDDGDDLLAEYDTIATVPLFNYREGNLATQEQQQQHTQSTYITQPTQPLARPIHPRQSSPSVIEVARSSPQPESPRSPSPSHEAAPATSHVSNGGRLAGIIAPPGTHFRSPYVQSQTQQQNTGRAYLDRSSDDEIGRYDSSSSDNEEQRQQQADIKPSVFAKGGQPIRFDRNGAVSRIEESPTSQTSSPKSAFKDLTEKFRYSNSSSEGLKRSADVMANAYGTAKRPVKAARQTGPSKAKSVDEDEDDGDELSLDDITDYSVRTGVERIRAIVPGLSVARCQRALLKKRGNVEDALDLISTELEQEEAKKTKRVEEAKKVAIDLTSPEPTRSFKRPLTKDHRQDYKRGVDTKKSITDKYSNTAQIITRFTKPQSTGSLAPAQDGDKSPSTPPPKPRRRLVQGRKQPSSPDPLSETPPSKPSIPLTIDSDPDENDSGIEVQAEAEAETGMGERLLQFLNTCSLPELLDVSNQPQKHVEFVIAKRPFKSLDSVRDVSIESATKTKTGKASTRKNRVGDRLVDVCLEMWTGYEAVDELVKRCEQLGKPIAAEMNNWGINVFGKSSEEEIQIVDLGEFSHDSGIGTPVSSAASTEEDQEAPKSLKRAKQRQFLKQPSIMSSDITLKDYQVAGLNWLNLLFQNRLSCILADDMGLGKTCQVISFLAHLYETGIKGPHIIIVPGSTLENWLREFQHFCPKLRVEPYYGLQAERSELRYTLREELSEINVIVTTYDMAISSKKDSDFLRAISPVACVYDEGHALKNSASKRYRELMKIPAQFRLLLTGTPLQNNLQELVSLLAFIMPGMFLDRSEDLEYIFKHRAKTTDADHTALLSAQRISRARSMMKPFILRRKKHQVLKHLPKKTNQVEYCEMSPAQAAIYEQEVAKVKQALLDREAEPKSRSSTKMKTNALMDLRKAAIHPLLFRRLYDDEKLRKMSKACLKEPTFRESDAQLVFEDMQVMTDFELLRFCTTYPNSMSAFAVQGKPWLDSGKVTALVALLKKHAANGDRTILFSQFTMVMDILEEVFQSASIPFSRLDGSTQMAQRQDLIDQFYEDESISVFMLSTKAGGTGINLVCANKVIIFDSSFNPQEDVQAENRAHRVGQTREVEVVRLVTRGTVEEQILALGESKLVLDERVAGADADADADANSDANSGKKKSNEEAEREGAALVEQMLSAKFEANKNEPTSGGAETAAAPAKDLKDEFMSGLKAGGLDVSSSSVSAS